MELLEYAKVMLEDLQIGTGTKEVRLQGQRVVQLTEIHLGGLVPIATYQVRPVAGQPTMTLAAALPAGHRVWGVTAYILTTFGISQGLSGLLIGDSVISNRWGTLSTLTAGTVTDQSSFASGDMPIYQTAGSLIITAIGGLFDGVGELELDIHSHPLTHRGRI